MTEPEMPDMTIGSKPWTTKAVCDHYAGDGDLRLTQIVNDVVWAMWYDCPRCGSEGGKFILNLTSGIGTCLDTGCALQDLDSVGLVAEMEGIDPRSRREEAYAKRHQIIRAAKDSTAASMVESREAQEIEAQEIESAKAYVRAQRAREEKDARQREIMAARRADAMRHEVVVPRVVVARGPLVWRELLLAIVLLLAVLIPSYYAVPMVAEWSSYGPAPAGQGFGSEEPDSWPIAVLRDLVAGVVTPGVVTHRVPLGLLLSAVIICPVWYVQSRLRWREHALGEDERVGIYYRDDEGVVRWR